MNFNSADYWEERYKKNGNSGSGSYNDLADFKSQFINKFIVDEDIKNVIDFGCGDGNQIKSFNIQNYLGFDISREAINICAQKFHKDDNKKFLHTSEYIDQKAQLTMSLDVIFHLIEDDVYNRYMSNLFTASSKFVMIYSSNFDDDSYAIHFKSRKFSDWISSNFSDFELYKHLPNKYPYTPDNPENTSLSDFYVYKKN